MKKKSQSINIILTVSFLISIAVLLFLFSPLINPMNNSCEKKLYTFKGIWNDTFKLSAIGSGSMYPLFGKGDMLTFAYFSDYKDLDVCDVIIFKIDDDANIVDGIPHKDMFVHRIIIKGEDDKGMFFVTKGDNMAIDDRFVFGRIRPNLVRGVVVGIYEK